MIRVSVVSREFAHPTATDFSVNGGLLSIIDEQGNVIAMYTEWMRVWKDDSGNLQD